MHSTTISAAILFASTALAVPMKRTESTTTSSSSSDSDVRVLIQNTDPKLGFWQGFFSGLSAETRSVSGHSTFTTIEVQVGPKNPNQALRCKALDSAGNALIATRGANTDITFADGGNGPWTFKEPAQISNVICDPAFQKIGAEAFEVRVLLQNQAIELGLPVTFPKVDAPDEQSLREDSEFETVELTVGELAQQNLRCQALDTKGEPLVVLRNGNRDITFADGDAGLWTFEHKSAVSKIVCDPTFVKGSA